MPDSAWGQLMYYYYILNIKKSNKSLKILSQLVVR